MLNFFKKHKNFYFIIVLLILNNCQFQEPSNNHGVLFLENRAKKIKINSSNVNDVIKVLGSPHVKSVKNNNEWIYIERTLIKGEYHKLGRHILKSNNVLIVRFDKYGILREKKILNKEDIKKLTFSKKETQNKLTQKSFIEKFLSSIRNKMYGNRENID